MAAYVGTKISVLDHNTYAKMRASNRAQAEAILNLIATKLCDNLPSPLSPQPKSPSIPSSVDIADIMSNSATTWTRCK